MISISGWNLDIYYEKISQSNTEIDAENYENYEIENGPFRKKLN